MGGISYINTDISYTQDERKPPMETTDMQGVVLSLVVGILTSAIWALHYAYQKIGQN